MNIRYRFSVLKKSRLPEVYRLAHDANVEAGYIQTKPDRMFINHRDIDESENTVVIGAIQEENLIGTCTVSAGEDCRHIIETLFPEEQALVDSIYEKAIPGTVWRLATDHTLRNNRSLITGLIQTSLKVSSDLGIDTLLVMFADRHTRFYQNLLDGQVLAEKRDRYQNRNVDMVLMSIHVQTANRKLSGICKNQ